MSQLALPLKLSDFAVFENFWPAGNDALVAYLNELTASGDGPRADRRRITRLEYRSAD